MGTPLFMKGGGAKNSTNKEEVSYENSDGQSYEDDGGKMGIELAPISILGMY